MKILVPVDFSEISANAVRQAVALAEKSRSSLVLYHVYHRPAMPEDVLPEKSAQLLHKKQLQVQASYQQFLEAVPELASVPFTFQSELGISTRKIPEKAASEQADLVVMGTKGAWGFNEIWGSKTGKVSEAIECPLLIIPPKAELGNVKSIGFACDYRQEHVNEGLYHLSVFASLLGACVQVITVVSPKEQMQQTSPETPRKEEINGVDYSFHYVSNKDVATGLLEYSEEQQISIIALLRGKYSFIEKLFHESLTQFMVEHASKPLLVFK